MDRRMFVEGLAGALLAAAADSRADVGRAVAFESASYRRVGTLTSAAVAPARR